MTDTRKVRIDYICNKDNSKIELNPNQSVLTSYTFLQGTAYTWPGVDVELYPGNSFCWGGGTKTVTAVTNGQYASDFSIEVELSGDTRINFSVDAATPAMSAQTFTVTYTYSRDFLTPNTLIEKTINVQLEVVECIKTFTTW